MNKRFIGVDCSSKSIHYISLDELGRIVESGKVVSSHKDMDNRLIELFNQFDQVSFFNNAVCTVESAIYLQNVKATISIAQVVAAVKISMSRKAIPCFAIDNRSWKKVVLSDGNANKEKIMLFAQTKWGKDFFIEQDYADAACIAFYNLLRFSQSVKD